MFTRTDISMVLTCVTGYNVALPDVPPFNGDFMEFIRSVSSEPDASVLALGSLNNKIVKPILLSSYPELFKQDVHDDVANFCLRLRISCNALQHPTYKYSKQYQSLIRDFLHFELAPKHDLLLDYEISSSSSRALSQVLSDLHFPTPSSLKGQYEI